MKTLVSKLMFISLALCLIMPAIPVRAVTAANWQAGRIIDDSVFANKDSMSVAEIQTFLNQNVGTNSYGTPGQCDTNGLKTSELGGGTRAQYGAAHNNPTPFTCLKDYYEVPKLTPSPGIPASNYGGAPIPAGAKSAANLIYDAAQTYRISPRVLLVTIQKESAGPLITDDWPFKSQYTYAMGAHCPDSGPGGTANCDVNYSGFSIQIAESAALFRYYLDNMTASWWPYKKLGNNNILYNPNTGCGSTNVNITTSATAALYTYTPYQPNQAALNNMYGLGDGCSAYGNRNFWRIYNDWFGTTIGPDYSAEFLSISADRDTSQLVAGEKALISVTVKNNGRSPWYNHGSNPVRIATNNPPDRRSVVYDNSWPAYNRPSNLSVSGIAVGDTTVFSFWIQAPATPGFYNENFSLVAENLTFFTTFNFALPLNILPVTGSATVTYENVPTRMDGGDMESITIKAKNETNTTWRKNSAYPLKISALSSAPYFFNNKITDLSTMSEDIVQPGETATFNFVLTAPTSTNNYAVSFIVNAANLKTYDGGISKAISVTKKPKLSSARYNNHLTRDFLGINNNQAVVWEPINGVWSGPLLTPVQFGSLGAGDVPVPGDYDGDGKTDVAVWRQNSGYWFVRRSSDGVVTNKYVSGPRGSLLAVPGKYDADNKSDIAVWDYVSGEWRVFGSLSSYNELEAVSFGSLGAGDVPVPGDYDGDGKTDVAVWRQNSGYWFVRRSSDGVVTSQQWGSLGAGDVPVPGDYDGDGKTDVAVWRQNSGYWFVRRSSDGVVTSQQWGSLGDIPI